MPLAGQTPEHTTPPVLPMVSAGRAQVRFVAEFFGPTTKASDRGDPTSTPCPNRHVVRLARTVSIRTSSLQGDFVVKRPCRATGITAFTLPIFLSIH